MPSQDPEKIHARWREASKRYRQAHPERIKASNAKAYYADVEASRDRHRRYVRANRAEETSRSKKWRARNPEKSRRIRLRYVQGHLAQVQAGNAEHRARKYGAAICDLSAEQWHEIKAAYGFRCVYCGRKMQRLTQDHLTPLSKGGHHTASNVVPACKSCNSRKYTGDPLVPTQPLLLTIAPATKKRGKR